MGLYLDTYGAVRTEPHNSYIPSERIREATRGTTKLSVEWRQDRFRFVQHVMVDLVELLMTRASIHSGSLPTAGPIHSGLFLHAMWTKRDELRP
jgi:hypothetical protein